MLRSLRRVKKRIQKPRRMLRPLRRVEKRNQESRKQLGSSCARWRIQCGHGLPPSIELIYANFRMKYTSDLIARFENMSRIVQVTMVQYDVGKQS